MATNKCLEWFEENYKDYIIELTPDETRQFLGICDSQTIEDSDNQET